MGGLLRLDRSGGWFAEQREKITNKIRAYRERREIKHLKLHRVSAQNKDSPVDEDDEAARLVQHSRIDWTPSDLPSLDGNQLRTSRSQSTLAPPFPGFAGRNTSFSLLSSSARPSQTISSHSQSSSPENIHSRILRPQIQKYAHTAWTPPDETFDEDDDVYRRAFVRHVEKAASQGRFDSEAINTRFDTFYRNRSTPDLQVFASSEFQRRSEARAEKRKLQFELTHSRKTGGSHHSSESRFVTAKSEYQLEFQSGLDRSGLGDIIGEAMGRSGGINGM